MHKLPVFIALCFAALAPLAPAAAAGPDSVTVAPAPAPTYADLADLTDGAPLVIRAQPRKLVPIEAARALGLKPGWGRFYVEAKTEALIFGRSGLGEQLRYLVDLRLDARGKAPVLKKKSVVLFARAVPGRPGELQLVAPDAQLLWDPPLEARLRALIAELNAPAPPPRVTGVREAIFVPGNLAGESETQLFLATLAGDPAAITISRQPGQAARWGLSFSELVGDAAAPARDTLAWYRLACFLPPVLPDSANTSGTPDDRIAAGRDYRFVLDQLGSCPRTRQ